MSVRVHSKRKITDCIKFAEDIYEKRKVCNNFWHRLQLVPRDAYEKKGETYPLWPSDPMYMSIQVRYSYREMWGWGNSLIHKSHVQKYGIFARVHSLMFIVFLVMYTRRSVECAESVLYVCEIVKMLATTCKFIHSCHIIEILYIIFVLICYFYYIKL